MNAGLSSNVRNNALVNSLIKPVNMLNSAVNSTANSILENLGVTPVNTNASSGMGSYMGLLMVLIVVGVISAVLYVYRTDVERAWNDVKDTLTKYFEQPVAPSSRSAPAEGDKEKKEGEPSDQKGGLPFDKQAATNLEKILPGGKEVFNVSTNKFTYYDAAPMCKALGAELATYDQVKDAFSKGADWCNYGWVQGQMAVYPTQKETYEKLQLGPEEQRMTCGTVGVNGGYFDNPEMRFGVNCYGAKPPKSQHDAAELSKGAPISPDALAFEKKVNQYKSDADTIGINPFNTSRW
jgi:hypothetical protein